MTGIWSPLPRGDADAPPESVRLWIGQVGDMLDPDDVAVLSPDERDRVERLALPAQRARHTAARAAMRRVLARHLGVAPAEVRLERTPCPRCGSDRHGPPVVTWPERRFATISHSADRWLLATARRFPLGVDLELTRDVDVPGVAKHALTQRERALVLGRAGDEQRTAFYRCWTRKEAVVKAAGVGIAADLRQIDVDPGNADPVQVTYVGNGAPSRWSVRDVPTGTGWHAALACPADRAVALEVTDLTTASSDSSRPPERSNRRPQVSRPQGARPTERTMARPRGTRRAT